MTQELKAKELHDEWQKVKILIKRSLESELHVKLWTEFELSNLLQFRCQIAAGCKILASIFLACLGKESMQVAEEFLKE